MKPMLRRMPRAWLLAVPLLYFLYFYGLTSMGLLGPDEPRYAAIGQEMARSGDWVTPRLWGKPWFEKPALLYWMTAAAFRLGLDEDLAPRIFVAVLGVAFLIFYQTILRREFGPRTGWFATAFLGASAGWLGYSHIGVTDLPMAATFSAAMLLSLRWVETGDQRRLPLAAALLGLAVLAKGFVPLVLALPLVVMGFRPLPDGRGSACGGPSRDRKGAVILAFLLVAAPWYLLCYLRNGAPFLQTFFWQHQLERFSSEALQHQQPFWFYLPVLPAALLPWAPLLALLFRRSLYSDRRRRFLVAWLLFGLVFFSASTNKLPGYVLPLLPAAAALMGLATAESKQARWPLAAAALCFIFVPILASLLPQALASGLSRSRLPAFEWNWMVPVFLGGAVWVLESGGRRAAAVAVMGLAVTAGVIFLKVETLPALDRAVSARPLWREIAGRRDQVCVAEMHRSWRYGLNYYSVTPLPNCAQAPRPLQVRQKPGHPPFLSAVAFSHIF